VLSDEARGQGNHEPHSFSVCEHFRKNEQYDGLTKEPCYNWHKVIMGLFMRIWATYSALVVLPLQNLKANQVNEYTCISTK